MEVLKEALTAAAMVEALEATAVLTTNSATR
jgi:hypothetical protein